MNLNEFICNYETNMIKNSKLLVQTIIFNVSELSFVRKYFVKYSH
jgi:hypothetical protein